MAIGDVLETFGTPTALTITLTSIANGAGRLAAQIDNTSVRAPKIRIAARVKSGAAAPTVGSVYRFYVVRYDTHGTAYADDGLGAADAAVATEPVAAWEIGTIPLTASANTSFYGCWVVPDPGPKWSLVFWNASGQTISTTEGDHFIHYETRIIQVQ